MNTFVKAARELFNTILPSLSYASTMNKGGVFSSAFYRLGKMGKVAVEQAQAGNLLLQFEPDGITYSEVTRDNVVPETYVVAEYNNTTDQEQTYTLQETEQFESQLTFSFAEDGNLDCTCSISLDLPAFFPTEENYKPGLTVAQVW
ncbi:MAG: hypothetical protein HC921_19990 [Synechococcaceae cyanobacterium SM2_3_1]|nr:hypothetical protein [Synechococcaceae cyanobacterium SM2_3_1]